MDEWYARQPDKVWVLRLTKDSTPFRESFLLSPPNDGNVLEPYAMFVFADASKQQLIDAFARTGVPN